MKKIHKHSLIFFIAGFVMGGFMAMYAVGQVTLR